MASSKKKSMTVLKKIAILSDLTEDELKIVWDIALEVEIQKGNILMSEGDFGDSMYFFVEGEVNVSKNLTLKVGKKAFSHTDKSMVKLRAEHVSFFGDMAMFQSEPRSATITANTKCILYEVKRDNFTEICNSHPIMGVKILRRISETLCGRVRKGNDDVLKLTAALSLALSR